MSKFKVLTALFLPAVLFCTLASGADNKVRELKVYGKRAYKKPIKLGGLCWQLSGEFRTDGEPTEVVLGMELLDKDGNQIYPFVFTAFPGTETTLVKPVKKGDTTLVVKEARNWNAKLGKLAVPAASFKELGVHPRDVALEFKTLKKTAAGYELTLVKPVKFDLPAGSVVRQHTGVPPFSAGWRRMVGGKWTWFDKYIFPGTRNGWEVWEKAVTGRIFIQAPPGVTVYFRNVECKPVFGGVGTCIPETRRAETLTLYFAGKGKPVLTPDGGTAWKMKPQAALRRTDLRFKASEAQQIEALVSADTPGMLGTFVYGFDGKKNFMIPRATPVIPDGKPHWVIVHPRYPSDDSVVTALDFGWRNLWGCTVRIEKVRVLEERNFVPGAELRLFEQPIFMDYLWGGREYRLEWLNGNSGGAPKVSIKWLDGEDREIGSTELPAGYTSLKFSPPATTARGVLTVHGYGAG
ncbi:MAG: hypothetical protein J6Y54_03195, partial [Lentisphaeria bacterium]|nr:hypothetical protein [Lentisphaeria bacterium]